LKKENIEPFEYEIKLMLEIFKKNYPKEDLKAYRGIGVKMLGAPFQ